MFTVSPSLVQPRHFSEVACLKEVYEGDLQTYLQMKRGKQEQVCPRTMKYVEVVGVPFACAITGTFSIFVLFRYSRKTCDNGENDGMDDKMTKTIDLQVNARNIADMKKGYPLILKKRL